MLWFLIKSRQTRNTTWLLISLCLFLCSPLGQSLQKWMSILAVTIPPFQFFLELPPMRLSYPVHHQMTVVRTTGDLHVVLVWLFLSVTLDHSPLLDMFLTCLSVHVVLLATSFSTSLTVSSQSSLLVSPHLPQLPGLRCPRAQSLGGFFFYLHSLLWWLHRASRF